MDNKRKNKLMKEINKSSKKSGASFKSNIKASKSMDSKKKSKASLLDNFKSADQQSKNRVIALVAIALIVCLVVVIAVVASNSSKSKTKKNTAKATTQDPLKNNPLVESKNEKVNELVNKYIDAMAKCDVNTMKSLDENQEIYISDQDFKNTASVIEGYTNRKIYLKNGPYDNGFVAYVVTDIKIKNITKTCQGMFQYVIKKEKDGSFKLDTSEDLEADITNKLVSIRQSEDVLALIDKVNKQCKEDINSDAKLKEYAQKILKMQP